MSHWTHFSIFEAWDNVRDDEISELEGLFRFIYRRETRTNSLNVQRGFRRLSKVRQNDFLNWGKEKAYAAWPGQLIPGLESIALLPIKNGHRVYRLALDISSLDSHGHHLSVFRDRTMDCFSDLAYLTVGDLASTMRHFSAGERRCLV